MDDFQRVSDRVPYLADLKPSGQYVMADLHEIGGTPAVMKYLLEGGYLDGSCMTVTGKTLAENLEPLPGLAEGQDLVHSLEKPLKKTGHLTILYGNLAPEGAVAKITGKEGTYFKGPARVFDAEEDMLEGLKAGRDPEGRHRHHPVRRAKGRPGMPEMLTPTSAIIGAGLGKDVALLTDGRFSGGSHGFIIGMCARKPRKAAPSPSCRTATS